MKTIGKPRDDGVTRRDGSQRTTYAGVFQYDYRCCECDSTQYRYSGELGDEDTCRACGARQIVYRADDPSY